MCLNVAEVLWGTGFDAQFVSLGIGVEVGDVDIADVADVATMMLMMMMMMMLALVLVLLLWFFRRPMQSRAQYRKCWCD